MLLGREQSAAIPATRSLTEWLLLHHRPMMQRCSDQFVRGPALFDVPVVGWMLPLEAVEPLAGTIESQLLPPSVSRSAEIRRKSFIAGRLCAERCLDELEIRGEGVGRDSSGVPLWPHGVVGSITHNARFAVAVACVTSSVQSMGIDSESLVQVQAAEAIEKNCCTEDERLSLLADGNSALVLTLIFSAKESFYKAIYPLVERYVDFADVEVRAVDWRRQEFLVGPVPTRPFAQLLPTLQGRFSVDGGQLHTGVAYIAGRILGSSATT